MGRGDGGDGGVEGRFGAVIGECRGGCYGGVRECGEDVVGYGGGEEGDVGGGGEGEGGRLDWCGGWYRLAGRVACCGSLLEEILFRGIWDVK